MRLSHITWHSPKPHRKARLVIKTREDKLIVDFDPTASYLVKFEKSFIMNFKIQLLREGCWPRYKTYTRGFISVEHTSHLEPSCRQVYIGPPQLVGDLRLTIEALNYGWTSVKTRVHSRRTEPVERVYLRPQVERLKEKNKSNWLGLFLI